MTTRPAPLHPRPLRRGALVVAGAVAWCLFGAHAGAVTRSVTDVLRDTTTFASGFRPPSSPCEVHFTTTDDELNHAMVAPREGWFEADVARHVARLHAVAHSVWTRRDAGPLDTGCDLALVRAIAALDLIQLDRLTPHGFELLVIFAKLSAVLPDRPQRSLPLYYGLRGVLEKVVDMKHDESARTHALLAQALEQLATIRVARLAQIGRFEEQVRLAFDDLERLQREDALGDREHLRTPTALAVFAHVLPALSLHPAPERANRASELLRRFEPTEVGIRMHLNKRNANDVHRHALLRQRVAALLATSAIDEVPGLRARVLRLHTDLTRSSVESRL